jgi:hypothetical protein
MPDGLGMTRFNEEVGLRGDNFGDVDVASSTAELYKARLSEVTNGIVAKIAQVVPVYLSQSPPITDIETGP